MNFKEYKKLRDMPLQERRKYMALDATRVADTFPLPPSVINTLNMLPPQKRTSFIRWIFTEGLRQSLLRRRWLTKKMQEKGIDITQDGLFNSKAMEQNPQLADAYEDLMKSWEDIGGEPQTVKIGKNSKVNLGDINANLAEKGMETLDFGGKDGLIEYIEKGGWARDGIMPDSAYDKQGHDLSLPDDDKESGKYYDKETGKYIYKFGTSPSGGFVAPVNMKSWVEFLKEAKRKTQKAVGNAVKKIQSGQELDNHEMSWIQDKMFDQNGNLDPEAYEDTTVRISDTLGMSQRNAKKKSDDPVHSKMISGRISAEDTGHMAPETLASMKAGYKIALKHMMDYTAYQRDDSGEIIPNKKTGKPQRVAGIAPDPYAGTARVAAQGAAENPDWSMEIDNSMDLSDPRVKEELAEKIASWIVNDDGTIANEINVSRNKGNDKFKIRVPAGDILNGKWGNAALKNQIENEENVSTSYMGKDYDFDINDIASLNKKGHGELNKVKMRYYMSPRDVVDADPEEINPEEYISNGYKPTKVKSNVVSLEKDDDKFLARRTLEDGEEKWFKVGGTKEIYKDLPLTPNSMSIKVNTSQGQRERFPHNKEKKDKMWDDFLSNWENYGETRPPRDGSPSSVWKAISQLGSSSQMRGKEDSWKEPAANFASTQLSDNIGRQEFFYGDLKDFKNTTDALKKAGASKSTKGAVDFLRVLQKNINDERRSLVPGDVDIYQEPEGDGPLVVSQAIFDAMIKNGFDWRVKQAKSAAMRSFSSEKSDDIAYGAQDDDQAGFGVEDQADSSYSSDNEWGRDFGSEIDDDGEYVYDDEDDDMYNLSFDEPEDQPVGQEPEGKSDDYWASLGGKVGVDKDRLSTTDYSPTFAKNFKWGRPRKNYNFQAPRSQSAPDRPVAKPAAPAKSPRPSGLMGKVNAHKKASMQDKIAQFKKRKNESTLRSYQDWIAETEVVFDPKAATKKNRTFNTWGAPIKGKSIPTKVIDGDADTSKTDPVGKNG